MTSVFVPLFGPIPGGMEMVVILLIAVLLFGANKIPKLARSTGEAMGEFKKGRQEVEEELQEMSGDIDPEMDSDLGGSELESDTATDTDTTTDTDTETK